MIGVGGFLFRSPVSCIKDVCGCVVRDPGAEIKPAATRIKALQAFDAKRVALSLLLITVKKMFPCSL